MEHGTKKKLGWVAESRIPAAWRPFVGSKPTPAVEAQVRRVVENFLSASRRAAKETR